MWSECIPVWLLRFLCGAPGHVFVHQHVCCFTHRRDSLCCFALKCFFLSPSNIKVIASFWESHFDGSGKLIWVQSGWQWIPKLPLLLCRKAFPWQVWVPAGQGFQGPGWLSLAPLLSSLRTRRLRVHPAVFVRLQQEMCLLANRVVFGPS